MKLSRKISYKTSKNPQYYSDVAEDASDTSRKEQMSLVPISVDKNVDVRKESLGYLHCKSGLSGEALSETKYKVFANIMEQIKNYHIFQFFRAQPTFVARMCRIVCTRCT